MFENDFVSAAAQFKFSALRSPRDVHFMHDASNFAMIGAFVFKTFIMLAIMSYFSSDIRSLCHFIFFF